MTRDDPPPTMLCWAISLEERGDSPEPEPEPPDWCEDLRAVAAGPPPYSSSRVFTLVTLQDTQRSKRVPGEHFGHAKRFDGVVENE